MKKVIFVSITLLIHFVNIIGQTDTSVYKNLKRIKKYAVLLTRTSLDNKKDFYEVNGKKISKAEYEKFLGDTTVSGQCRPCILELYDEYHKKISEIVSYEDCGIGWFKEYYPNGLLKLKGKYKENPTNDWSNFVEKGFCSVPDGEWIYYNDEGKLLYTDYWRADQFLKQIPEQEENQVWKVVLNLYDSEITNQTIRIDQLNDLVVTAFYKNNSEMNKELMVDFQISAIGFQVKSVKFTPYEFKKVDFAQFFLDANIPLNVKLMCNVSIKDSRYFVKHYYLNILR